MLLEEIRKAADVFIYRKTFIKEQIIVIKNFLSTSNLLYTSIVSQEVTRKSTIKIPLPVNLFLFYTTKQIKLSLNLMIKTAL